MNIAETAAQLQTIQQAMILIHQSPDGDCIGSGYALAAAPSDGLSCGGTVQRPDSGTLCLSDS